MIIFVVKLPPLLLIILVVKPPRQGRDITIFGAICLWATSVQHGPLAGICAAEFCCCHPRLKPRKQRMDEEKFCPATKWFAEESFPVPARS